ncbi:hypothetical protein LINGRAHAP2_LOCUS18397 [Linum grandiflorum]
MSSSSSSRANNHYAGYDYYPSKCNEVKRLERSPPSPICVKFGSQKICSDNVDTVAEEFIRLEHKKFEASKTMSINYD